MVVNITKKVMAIDVVIPSVRPEELDFLFLLTMEVPKGTFVNFYIIIDCPGYFEFDSFVDPCRKIVVRSNSSNIGASASRNKGIDLSKGDYILFIDDDVIPERDLLLVYYNRIMENPNCFGFVGRTEFPTPINSFTSGILESDILTFFGISRTRKKAYWGTTSNLLIRRDIIGNNRFGCNFPKAGGGEDIDFCLNILQEGNCLLETVPEAIVKQGWWNDGKRSYRRFFRWAYGDSILPQLHRKYKYLNYPNLVETLVISIPFLTIISLMLGISLIVIPTFIILSFVADFFWESISVKLIRPSAKIISVIEGAIVRISNDLGRLIGNLSRRWFGGFLERFDYFMTGESIKFEQKIAGAKFISFSMTLFLIMFYRF